MRIAVMAAGAVGGYFGARLAAAGHEVFFIARGAHREAMEKDGLIILSVHGDAHLPKVNVTDDPAAVGSVDIVLFAVKLWDTEKAAAQAKPLVGPDTRVITVQNGVDSYERIAPILGAANTIPGVTYVFSVIERPGVIRQSSQSQSITCGTIDGKPDHALADFAIVAKSAGFPVVVSDNIERDRWQKFVFLSANSGATAVTRQTIGPILADPDTRAMYRAIMQETFAVARAKGIALDDGFIDERMGFADKLSPGMRASMANDLIGGNRLELDWLAGKVCALGRELRVPTPVNATIYAALKAYRMGRPKK